MNIKSAGRETNHIKCRWYDQPTNYWGNNHANFRHVCRIPIQRNGVGLQPPTWQEGVTILQLWSPSHQVPCECGKHIWPISGYYYCRLGRAWGIWVCVPFKSKPILQKLAFNCVAFCWLCWAWWRCEQMCAASRTTMVLPHCHYIGMPVTYVSHFRHAH